MEDVDWIYLSEERNQRQAVVNTVMNRRLSYLVIFTYMHYNHRHWVTAHLQFNNNNNNNNNILGICFMQDIYTYIPETNHVPREHRVTAILVLLFIVLI
jgi:hypothetical protein